MKNQKILSKLILVALVLIAKTSLHADILDMDIRVENSFSQADTTFYSGDNGIFLYAKVKYCINTDYPFTGRYSFRYEITDPRGLKVFEKTSDSNSIPTVIVDIERREYTFPSAFYSNPGDYTLTVHYVENYPDGRTISQSKSTSFRIVPGSRPGFSADVAMLIQPFDNETNVYFYPTFNWTPVRAGVKYRIFLSKQTNPEDNIIWQQSDLSEPRTVYSGNIPLEQNTRYYWLIQTTDTNGAPIGANLGRSEVFSFIVGESGFSEKITVLYPNNEIIANSFPKFRWSYLHDNSEEVEYEIILAKRNTGNLIMTKRMKINEMQYNGSMPLFEDGEIYFWKVVAVKSNNKNSESEWIKFTYLLPTVSYDGYEEETSLQVRVASDRGILLSGANVYLEKKESLSGTPISEFRTSISTDSKGEFSLSNLEPGKYKIMCEYVLPDSEYFYDEIFTLYPNENKELSITMENQVSRFIIKTVTEAGNILPNTAVTLKNEKYTWQKTSNAEGVVEFFLTDGYYSYEATHGAQYQKTKENSFYVKGEVNKFAILKRVQSGAGRFETIRLGSLQPLQDVEIVGEIQ